MHSPKAERPVQLTGHLCAGRQLFGYGVGDDSTVIDLHINNFDAIQGTLVGILATAFRKESSLVQNHLKKSTALMTFLYKSGEGT